MIRLCLLRLPLLFLVGLPEKLKLTATNQDRLVVRFLRIDLIVSGSNPPQLCFHIELEQPLALCSSKRRHHEVWSNREEGPGHCPIGKILVVPKLLPTDAR